MKNPFEQIDKEPDREKEVRCWGGTTSPNHHNPNQYRYLVHAFNPLATIFQRTIEAASKQTKAKDKSEGNQAINLWEEPQRLGERVSLSMSLIDQNRAGTWGGSGIIVEAPEENIVLTSQTDAGTINANRELLLGQAKKTALMSGDELINCTEPSFYNEVIALAKSDNGQTLKLKGFFIKVDKNRHPIEEVSAEQMKQHAHRHNLPLIEIMVRGPYEQEKFEINENGYIWAHYNGNRYNLGSDDPEIDFQAYDDKINPFFPPMEEIKEVVQHFIKTGDLSNAQSEQIIEHYHAADLKRKQPKIKLDKETGDIQNVIIKEGYGKNSVEYWLGTSGYCFKVDMEELKRALKESSFSQWKKNIPLTQYQIPLSANEVLTLLSNKKDIMEKEEYQKLFQYFSEIAKQIDKRQLEIWQLVSMR